MSGRPKEMSEARAPAAQPDRWSVHPDVVAERVGGGLVVVHLGTNRILELNATAGRCLELLREGLDRGEIERRLAAEYDVDAGLLARELDELLAQLRTHEIVR